jgi:hypothetical protein
MRFTSKYLNRLLSKSRSRFTREIAVAQALERQSCQGEFLSERSEDRFPTRLIRFPRSHAVEAFSRFRIVAVKSQYRFQ